MFQKQYQEKLKQQEISLKMQFSLERKMLEAKRKETQRQTMLMSTHQQTYAKIKEANEICQTMEKKIKFTPCLVRTEENKKETLKIQVERYDNHKTSVLWESD